MGLSFKLDAARTNNQSPSTKNPWVWVGPKEKSPQNNLRAKKGDKNRANVDDGNKSVYGDHAEDSKNVSAKSYDFSRCNSIKIRPSSTLTQKRVISALEGMGVCVTLE